MEYKDLKKFLSETLEQLKMEKSKYLEEMKEASSYLHHRTNEWHSVVPKTKTYSNQPRYCLNMTIDGIAGYLISPNVSWFKFVTRGKNFEKSDTMYMANDWLEDVSQLEKDLFNNCKFYSVTRAALEDAMITGTSYEMITDKLASETNKIVYEAYNPYECYVSENEDGEIDTFFREFVLTANMAYKKYGEDLPESIKELVRNGAGHTECTFVHAIFPREDYKRGPIVASKSKRYASIHWAKTGDEIIRESGFDEFPLAVHRWKKVGGSAYGMGMIMEYLPIIREINELQKQYDIAVQFQTSPIIQAPETLRNRFVYRPGAVNYASPNSGKPEVIQTQLNIQFLENRLAGMRQEISSLFYADLFTVLMRQDRQRTAYEVAEIKGEGLILLSAIIGTMQDEKLNPLVLRTFKIMTRSGRLPQPPEELLKASSEGRLVLELDGPLAQTMKAYHQATGLEQGLAAVASAVQIFPDEIVQVDGAEIVRQYATAKGLPQSCIREIADVKKIKQQQLENMQAQAQQQQALQQSEMLKNMGYDASSVAGMSQAPQQTMGGAY